MSSVRAIEVLSEVDPDFAAICQVLYGEDVEAYEVWDDVFGFAKSNTTAPNHNDALKRIGLAATLIGTGLGVGEIAEHAPKVFPSLAKPAAQLKTMAAKAPGGTLVPKVLGNSKFRLGAAGVMLGGDLAATAGLKQSEDDDPPVSKGVLRSSGHSVHVLARGILQGIKKAPIAAQKIATPEAVAARAKTIDNAAAVGRTMKNKAVLGGVGGTAAVAAGVKHHQNNKPIGYDQAYEETIGKGDLSFDAVGVFSKFDTDKRLAFGWASVVKKDGVDVVDRQGDYMTIDDVEDAAYKYVMTSRIGGDMHKRDGDRPHHVSDMVESFVITPEKIAKMGLPENTPQGWWVGFKIHDDNAWHEVKIGKKLGFSIHGKGKRADHELAGF